MINWFKKYKEKMINALFIFVGVSNLLFAFSYGLNYYQPSKCYIVSLMIAIGILFLFIKYEDYNVKEK